MLLAIDWNRPLTTGEAVIGLILVGGYLLFVILENFLKKEKKDV